MKPLLIFGIFLLVIVFVSMATITQLPSLNQTQDNQTFGCNQDSDCFKGGCSGEICSSEPGAVSVCIYKDAYECLRLTNCSCIEHKCQWQPNPAFNSCWAEKAQNLAK